MSASILTPGNLIGLAAVAVIIGILAYVRFTRREPPQHAIQAKTSHRAPPTWTLGGAVAAAIHRADSPAPAPAAAPATEDDDSLIPASLYPPAGELVKGCIPAGIYAHTMRAMAARTGTTTRYEDTASWPAITEDTPLLVVEVDEVANTVAEPAPAPEPVLALAATPVPLELEPAKEAAMQRFEDAHAEEIAAAGDATETDRAGFETGRDL
jgi:hypothetical protein